MFVRRLSAFVILTLCCATSGCTPPPQDAGVVITVVTHDSWAVPADIVRDFESASGIRLEFVAPGDAGTLVNQLILTRDHPLGDVVYGIDNTFASRAIDAGVLRDFASDGAAARDASAYRIGGSDALTAIDYSDVCINVDHGWFAERGAEEPETLDDLVQPEYRGLLTVTSPATSSPGLAFLLATVAAFDDGWEDYWEALVANDVRIDASWSDAYFNDFSGPSSGGDRPLVLSYASSPPFEVSGGEAPETSALLATCFRQVEYAGVIAGTEHVTESEAVIDWMLSDDFQSALPDNMYVYPVSRSVAIPESWARYAPLSPEPWTLDPETIAARRDELLRAWLAVVGS